jgi:hypothetical protein
VWAARRGTNDRDRQSTGAESNNTDVSGGIMAQDHQPGTGHKVVHHLRWKCTALLCTLTRWDPMLTVCRRGSDAPPDTGDASAAAKHEGERRLFSTLREATVDRLRTIAVSEGVRNHHHDWR